jgi:hypothetical protein
MRLAVAQEADGEAHVATVYMYGTLTILASYVGSDKRRCA